MRIFFVAVLLIIIVVNYSAAADNKQLVSTEEKAEITVPKNLDECFVELDKQLSDVDLEDFRMKDEEKAVAEAHFGLGMWIRNNWRLWSDSALTRYFHQIGIFHPDDMSGIILTSFHRFLNKKEIKLDEQIKYYQDYWKKIKDTHESDKP